jgi:hypothetical protein
MATAGYSEQRNELQHNMRNYAEMIWEAGGDTRIAHDSEVQILLGIEALTRAFRERLERNP